VRSELSQPSALVVSSLDDVRWAARRAGALVPNLRAVIAPHIPSGTLPIFAGLGILALTAEARAIEQLQTQASIGLPALEKANSNELVSVSAGDATLELRWSAVGLEREWTQAGSARTKH
jgi:hypothetical protein